MDDAHVLSGVGVRLRRLRRASGWRLSDVEERTGLTPSTLSRLERGLLQPTLGQLLPLARLYDLPLDDLVGAPSFGDPRVRLKPVRRDGIDFVPLGVHRGRLQAFKVVYPPADQLPPPRLHQHPGRGWMYVLSGAIRLLSRGGHDDFSAGEAVEFDTGSPHWVGNPSPSSPAETLMIYGRQGERIPVTDLHARSAARDTATS